MSAQLRPTVHRSFVVTPTIRRDESLPGYLLRLAEANFLDSPRRFPVLQDGSGYFYDCQVHRLAGDAHALRELEVMSMQPPGALTSRRWLPVMSTAGRYAGLNGQVLPHDALMLVHAQVCPRCLATDDPYTRDEWDLSHVTTCLEHRCLLVDSCPACPKPLQWARAQLSHCGRCFADLRASTVIECDDTETLVTELAGGFAPFRFVGTEEETCAPEGLFELTRLVGTTPQQFASGCRPSGFSLLGVNERHRSARALAQCIQASRVVGTRVHERLTALLAYWLPTLGPRRVNERLYEFVVGDDYLPPRVRRFIALGADQSGIAPAWEVFGKRPPVLQSSAELRDFLGCGDNELNELFAKKFSFQRKAGHGYDADEVLAAQRYLEQRITTSRFDEVVGVAGLSDALLRRRVLKRLSLANHPTSFSASDVGILLDALQAQSARHGTTQHLPLRRLGSVGLAALSADDVATLVARVISGAVSDFHWYAPYKWEDMAFAEADLACLTEGAEATAAVEQVPLPPSTPVNAPRRRAKAK